MTQNALTTQIDGNHYKVLKIQPLEFAYRVNGSPCFLKLAKYASRHKLDRGGDLRKAIHCIQLEEELGAITNNPYEGIRVSQKYFITVLTEFCQGNSILYSALYAMYYGDYAEAISEIELMMTLEGF